MIDDRDAATARLREQGDEELLAIVAAHDTDEWEPEIFEIARAVLVERGVNVDAALAGMAPPVPVDHTADDLQIIATFNVVPDAAPVRAALESAGFDVFLVDENMSNVDPALWVVVQGVKVAVPRSQAEEAREFLAAADRGELAQSPETAIQCPSCGSANVKFVSYPGQRFAAVVVPILGGPPKSHYECADCGAYS